MADAFCFLGNEKSENLNINDFLFNDMVSMIHCIYLIIWCLLVAKQELLYKAVFSPANWKKKEKLFCFWLVICNMYSLKINSALLTDLYVFDEGNVAKISWNSMYRVVFVLYFVMFIHVLMIVSMYLSQSNETAIGGVT